MAPACIYALRSTETRSRPTINHAEPARERVQRSIPVRSASALMIIVTLTAATLRRSRRGRSNSGPPFPPRWASRRWWLARVWLPTAARSDPSIISTTTPIMAESRRRFIAATPTGRTTDTPPIGSFRGPISAKPNSIARDGLGPLQNGPPQKYGDNNTGTLVSRSGSSRAQRRPVHRRTASAVLNKSRGGSPAFYKIK